MSLASVSSLWQTSLERLASRLSWPYWALETVLVLVVIMAIVSGLEFLLTKSVSDTDNKSQAGVKPVPKGFRWFQFQYLSVYLTIMLADWLQGTNMYTLYSVSLTFIH